MYSSILWAGRSIRWHSGVCPAPLAGATAVAPRSRPGSATVNTYQTGRAHRRRRVQPARGAEEAAGSAFAPPESTTITDAAVLGTTAPESQRGNGGREQGSVLPSAEEAPTAGVEAISSGLNTPDLEQLQAQQDLQRTAVSEKTGGPSGLALIAFTVPTLAVWLINPILSLVDTAVVGLQSATDLAALAPGTMLIDYTAYIFTFLAVAVTNMLAISFACKDKEGAGRILSDALAIALGAGLILGVGLYAFAPFCLAQLAGERSAALVAPALTYVRIRCLGIPPAMVIFVTQAFFLAAMDPYTPLRAAIMAGLLNLFGDLWLVNGLGWGIAGAAWATAAAQIVTAGMLLVAMRKPLPARSNIAGWIIPVKAGIPTADAVKRFLLYAGPICGVLAIKTVLYSFLTAYATSLNLVSAAAHHVMLSIFMFFATAGDSVSQAAQSFLPSVIGQPDFAFRLGARLLKTGAAIGACNCILAASIVLGLPHLFTNSAEVAATMAGLTPLFCLTLMIHTSSMATEGIMLAGRDLMFLLVSYSTNMGLVLILLNLLKAQRIGIAGVWGCLVSFQSFRTVVNGWRLLASEKSTLKRTHGLPSIVCA